MLYVNLFVLKKKQQDQVDKKPRAGLRSRGQFALAGIKGVREGILESSLERKAGFKALEAGTPYSGVWASASLHGD